MEYVGPGIACLLFGVVGVISLFNPRGMADRFLNRVSPGRRVPTWPGGVTMLIISALFLVGMLSKLLA
ncbi:hypothetical protein GCM10010430_03250 [Kitasatospora cystarginea]|uniref:Uncharacterized protein n=1 Tax=Kitasatospora cystarginea TaxID=58350 RepID=A0ABN3DCM5_9ACTN